MCVFVHKLEMHMCVHPLQEIKKQPAVKAEMDKKVCKEEPCPVASVVEPAKDADVLAAVTDDYMTIDDSDEEMPAT